MKGTPKRADGHALAGGPACPKCANDVREAVMAAPAGTASPGQLWRAAKERHDAAWRAVGVRL